VIGPAGDFRQIPTMNTTDPYALHPPAGTPPESQTTLFAKLVDHPFLRGLEAAQLQVLSANAMPVDIPAGEVVFREGDSANRFYLIHSGELVLESMDTPDGRSTVIDTIGAGDVLGWSWMFPPYYWHFDARATKPTKATFFYGTRLREAFDADPKLAYALAVRVAEVVIQRLQATRRKLLHRPAAKAS
jgi:CRP/FNR family cyclic AMP-dependent transcriptional regulator